MEYRPYLNNNMIFIAGVSTLIPGAGFEDLYHPYEGDTRTFVAGFLEWVATF
jgi:hypothetical protein